MARTGRILTRKNLEVLRALQEIQRESGYSPTVREIATRLSLASPSTVQSHINKLVALGYVDRRGARRVITTDGLSLLNGGQPPELRGV